MEDRQNGQEQASRPSEEPDTEHWQLRHDTTTKSLGFLLFNEIMSDVTFVVGSEHVRIPAHKFMLAIRSTVFHAMFYGMLPTETEVEIPDIEPPAFRNMLQYLYVDQFEIEPDSAITTLYAAKKYAVPGLEKRCVELLAATLTPEKAFLLLTQARLFDMSHLVASCLDMIDNQTQACLNANCFLDIDYETLEVVLRRDTLNVKEICLYEAVMRWSQAECKRHDLAVTSENQRRVLKDCIGLIRYPIMSNEAFAQGPTKDGLLTEKEILHVILYVNRNPKSVCEFQDKPRRILTGSEIVCTRYNAYPNLCTLDNQFSYSMILQVNQLIFLSGFGLFGASYDKRYEFGVDIELVHIASKTIIASNKTRLVSNGTANPCKVLFKEPVAVLANTDYRANATIWGCNIFGTTTNLMTEVTVSCGNHDNVTFKFCDLNDAKTSKKGKIPQIIFHI